MMKTCTKCGVEKPQEEFSKKGKRRVGSRAQCKLCLSVYNAKWRADNPGKVKARAAKYNADNRDKVNTANVKWRTENPDKAKAAISKWRADNPGARRIYSHNRRAKVREDGGKLSKGLADKLFTLQTGKCACCGKPLGKNFQLDHIMPLALGGPNTDDNIQLLRQICNNQKHAKHPVDFMKQRGFLL